MRGVAVSHNTMLGDCRGAILPEEAEIVIAFQDSPSMGGGRRMTPQQVSALLNLSLLATHRGVKCVEDINIDCMAAISLERDLGSALPVVKKIVKTASGYPELSDAVKRINTLFKLDEQ